MKSENMRIDDIEALRAIAIIFTIVHHTIFLIPGPLFPFVHHYLTFWSGVDLFFAVSGFVIARAVFEKFARARDSQAVAMTMRSFWIKRAFRIWPTSWVWIAAYFAISIATVFPLSSEFSLEWRSVIASVLQVQNIHSWYCVATSQARECGNLGLWWSLSLEEQFYIVLPLLVILLRRRAIPLIALAVVIQMAIPRPPWTFLWSVRTDAIGLGVLIAVCTSYRARFEPRFMNTRPLAYLAIAALLFALSGAPADLDKEGFTPWSTGIVAAVSGTLVFIASFNKDYIVRWRPAKNVALYIGSRSYALYLAHLAVLIVVEKIQTSDHAPFGLHIGLSTIAIALPASFFLAELNYRFVEMPLRMKGREIANRVSDATRRASVAIISPAQE